MVKTWFTRAAKSIRRRSMSLGHAARRLVIHRGRLSVLVAALVAAVCLAACGPSSSGNPPPPPGTESTGLYTPPTDPYAPSDETTDLYTPSDETPTDPYTPPDETNHCAYAGDPLCPDTALTIPPPDIGNWP